MTWDSLKQFVTWTSATVALLGGIMALFKETRRFLKWIWLQLKPAIKIVLATASLILPNALIVGLLMNRFAIYYYEAGSLDLIVTNSMVFLSLVGAQACLVSLYSFFWGIFAYPRIRKWLRSPSRNAHAEADVRIVKPKTEEDPK
jgi:hypothetical protein